ncbi:hypothetical protein [Chryseobacterium sp.]|uniref:hypothetical protein n=1 Tax=Chryseobacterium sp. TaxID=1871047 RepID=UPI002FC5BD99
MKKSSRFYLKYNPDNRWSFWTGKWWSLCSEISGQFIPKSGGQFDRLFQYTVSLQLINNASEEILSSSIIGGKMKISLSLSSEAPEAIVNKANAEFNIIDSSTNQILYSKIIFIPKLHQSVDFINEFNTEAGKNYKLEFKIKNHCNQCEGQATIEYQDGWKQVEDGNIRLKKQFDINESTNVKRYYYNP